MLGAMRLHHVEQVDRHGVEYIHKRRRLMAGLIIPPGNLYFRITGNPSEVLSRGRWLEWERSVDAATGRRWLASGETDRRGLWYRRAPGISLRQLLADDALTLEQKFEAIGWSMVALRGLHACSADWGDGLQQSLSHGDATSANVIVDLDARTADWIDFETRHLPGIPELDRQADDLRALLDSAAVHLPAACYPRLAEVLVDAVRDEALLAHLAERIAEGGRASTAAQLAQAPLAWSAAQALRTALAYALAK